jgi:glycosyltransferase involved in cell wall biosynthesis
VTIHGLILLNFPTVKGTTLNPLYYKIKFLAYKLTIGLGIRRAKKIITVSEFTKQDIKRNYSWIKDKVVVTYEACDKEKKVAKKSESDSRILKKYGIIKPYILYVGNAYPHKNLERLIESFQDVGRENRELSLVLVGKEDYFYSQLKKLKSRIGIEKVIFAGFVPDDDLDVVYAASKAFIFPSLYEGFGLPPLEAMSMGVPVLSSDHLCMKEILGDSACYFDGRKKHEIANAILKISNDQVFSGSLKEKGFKQVSQYSWEKMARETRDVYCESLRLFEKNLF